MTTAKQSEACAVCGYVVPAAPCPVCAGKAERLGNRGTLEVGRGNALLDVLRGMNDVRRAVFVMIFGREFIGQLRLPVAMNALGIGIVFSIGWFWLSPAFESYFAAQPNQTDLNGPHLWLMAMWLTAGPAFLDMIGGWAQEPIRRATEHHMLGATLTTPPSSGQRLLDRLQMLLLIAIACLMALALVLIPWVGIPCTVLLGSAVAAIVWLQPPQAVRGATLRQRLEMLRRNPWRALGMGFGLQIAAGVPFVNLLALLPTATIAATSTFLHFDKSGRHAPEPEPND